VKSGRRNYKPPISEHHRPPGTTGSNRSSGSGGAGFPPSAPLRASGVRSRPARVFARDAGHSGGRQTPMFKEDVKAGDFGSAYAAAAVEMDALGRPVRCVTSRMQAFGTQTYRAETPHIFA